MPKSKQQKQSDLKELQARIAEAKSVVFAQFRGTTVKSVDLVRRGLEREQVSSKVYKLTLLDKALKEQGIEAQVNFGVPVVVAASSTDDVAPARILKKFSKEIPTVGILGGIVGGQFYSKEQMLALADLPTRNELLGRLVETINAPLTGFVNVLAGNLRGLVNVLSAIASK